MNLRSCITFLAFLLCFSLGAQTTAEKAGKRAKKRAEYKTQNKVDRSVDKAVDDAFNAVGNLFKKKKKKNKEQPNANAPAGNPSTTATGNAGAKVKDGGAAPNNGEEYESDEETMGALSNLLGGGEPYEPFTNDVTFSMEMELIETKKNGKRTVSQVNFAITETKYGMKMSAEGNEDTRIIFDTQTGKTTMISTDKKGQTTGFRMKMPNIGGAVSHEESQETVDRFTFDVTGKRKTIEGYNCREMIITDTKKGTVTTTWFTDEVGITNQELYQGMMSAMGSNAKKMNMKNSSMQDVDIEGFPIYTITKDKGTTTEQYYRNIRKGNDIDRSILDTTGIAIQSVGF